MKEKVLVAMSGGIDSSAAAFLLKKDGGDTDGATMLFFKSSPTEDSIRVAAETCGLLGMKFMTFDFRDRFRKEVIDYFANSYINGETPNPCVRCNKKLKFAEYINEAEKLGYDKIATGHYAQTEYDSASDRWLLKKGSDILKDQSYFLYELSQKDLSRTLFPLGTLTKAEIREIAAEASLPSVHRAESQDICFLPDGDYRAFLEREFEYKAVPGDFIDKNGKVLGKHIGNASYTVGQRRGLGVSAESRLYVIDKDTALNTVTLGKEEDLHTSKVVLRDVNLIAINNLESPMKVDVKVRYSKNSEPATVYPESENSAVLVFDKPIRKPARGQAAVFYEENIVIGGGTVC